MFIKNFSESKNRVLKILNTPPTGQEGNLLNVVNETEQKKNKILGAARKYQTPFYLIDDKALRKNLKSFSSAFKKYLPQCLPCYAVKANYHPYILQKAVKAGFGLEVGSGRELKLALVHKPKTIIFNGPGKSAEELTLALKHSKLVTVNLDSFGELRRLGELAKKYKKTIKAGVRISTKFHFPWDQFGIPLKDLKKFFLESKKYPNINFQGIQFHLSWNRDTKKYKETFFELGRYLKNNFSKHELDSIKFIDFGGGFYQNLSEGYYPHANPRGIPLNGAVLADLANSAFKKKTEFIYKYYPIASISIDDYAKQISSYIKKYIKPILSCKYYCEPGRIICYSAMHIVLKVLDIKKKDLIIVDGGMNMQGWEYGQSFYFPIIDLTNFSKKEIKCDVRGSLCTTLDIWGHYCYAKKIKENDVIVVPNQGSYTYTLAQNFIKPIPNVYLMK